MLRLLKEKTEKVVAAVGDGENDVGMLTEADLGICITDKDESQAEYSSDFSLTKFGHLRKLVLCYGRKSYTGSAALAQFILQRGLTIAVMQTTFTILFYYVSIPLFNNYLQIGFSTIYTCIPIFALIFDNEMELVDYKSLGKGRFLNFKRFFEILWWSIYQGSSIIFLSALIFKDSFANIVSASFCSLIAMEWLMTWSQLRSYNFRIFLMQLSSLCLYSLSIYSITEYFDRLYLTQDFFIKVFTVALVAYLPYIIGRQCLKVCDGPSERRQEKIRNLQKGLK
jgi:phospholipid-translocating ATPase